MSHGDPVIVVGGGVVGIATAYYLARAGRSVTIVERDIGSTGERSLEPQGGLPLPRQHQPVPLDHDRAGFGSSCPPLLRLRRSSSMAAERK